MIQTHICFQNYRKYNETTSSIITGQGFYEEKHYKEEELAELVSSWSVKNDFLAGLNNLNGFYMLIRKEENILFAAVDRVRSIPLFYGQMGKTFYLSDNAEWIRSKVKDKELDSLAKKEFTLTGYVTGRDTLSSNVKQLQAGEALFVEYDEDEENLKVKIERYYKFVHRDDSYNNLKQLMDEHDKVLFNVFKRLIKVANGRPLLVPLSGGYDSRLIVLMLNRLNYKNVITFSYGRTRNRESEISQKIAKCLGLRWEFIPYSNEDWQNWYNSEELKTYRDFGSGLSSVAHIQDWPAVWKLKEQNLIPEDSIFIPGHTGDFISGGHIPVQFNNMEFIDDKCLLNSIYKKHYVLDKQARIIDTLDTLKGATISKILELSEATKSQNHVDAASKFEKWEWQERQAKFIINSVRAYDYWNYDWWLPLWDYEYMEFWCNVPLKFRLNQYLYKDYVNQMSPNEIRLILSEGDSNLSPKRTMKNVILSFFSDSLKQKLIQVLKYNEKSIIKNYHLHPLALWGIYTLDDCLINAERYENINSGLALDYIQYVSKNEQ